MSVGGKMLFVSKCHSNLVRTILSNSLPVQDVREMGLRFCGVSGFPGLGMSMILECFHLAGICPVSHITLNISSNLVWAVLGRFLSNLYVTASSPGVVLRRKEARALNSSPSVKGESSGVTSNCRGVRLLVGVGVLSG